jgi:hypothetical protein
MAVAAEVVTTILVVALVAAMALAMFVGILGAVFGEGFERCPRCKRMTMSVHGHAHPGGCPTGLHAHAVHLVDSTFRSLHLRHR